MYSVSFGSVQSSKVPSLHFLIVNFNPNLKGCCPPYYLDRPGLDLSLILNREFYSEWHEFQQGVSIAMTCPLFQSFWSAPLWDRRLRGECGEGSWLPWEIVVWQLGQHAVKRGKSRRGTRSISVSGEECVFEGSEVCMVHQTGWHWKSETNPRPCE